MPSIWKTPDSFWNNVTSTCEYEVRQEIGCTELFYNKGFLKNLVWDHYAEYETLCKKCPHYFKGCGIYFGNGHHTDDLSEQEIVWCRCRIKTLEELKAAADRFSGNTKAIILEDIRTPELSPLEAFANLECVVIKYCPKLERFWDFSKTPALSVLTYLSNNVLKDLSVLKGADNLQYCEIETLISRTNLMYVDSFWPLSDLPSLKELSLTCVMCRDNDISALIAIPSLEKLWISPNTFSTEDFARFESQKFRIYDEYGIYKSGEDYVCGLGKGKAAFRSEKSKRKFEEEYFQLMRKYSL